MKKHYIRTGFFAISPRSGTSEFQSSTRSTSSPLRPAPARLPDSEWDLTAVKAWAEVHGKPIAAISGLEAIAYESLAERPLRPSQPHLLQPSSTLAEGNSSVRYTNANIPGTKPDWNWSGDESILSPDEFLEMVKDKPAGPVVLVSPTPDVLPISRIYEVLPGKTVITVSSALGTGNRKAWALNVPSVEI